MKFWNEQSADPKRKFRWHLRFGTDGGAKELQLAAKKIDKPKFEISTTPHKFINHTFFFPGRLEWKPITATFADIGGTPDIAALFFGKIVGGVGSQGSGYQIPTNPEDCRKAITKEKSVDAFGSNFTIVQTDGEANPIEEWSLFNPWISTIEFGDLDYASEDLVEITITIVYDHAVKIR